MKEKLLKLRHLFVSPSLKSILKWISRYKSGIVLLSAGQMLAAALGLVFTVVTKGIVDSAVSADRAGMLWYAVLLVVTVLFQIGTAYALNYGNVRVSSRMRSEMRSSVIEGILEKQYSELARMHSGDLTGKILNDTNEIVSAVVSVMPHMLFLITQFLGAMVLLLSMDSRFVFVLIAFAVLGALLTVIAGNKMKAFHKKMRENEDRVYASVQENMQNMRIIKASGTEDRVKTKIWTRQLDYVEAQLARGHFSAAVHAGIQMAFRFGWLYTMIWGCGSIYRGMLSYGSLTAMLQLVGQIQSPIANMSSVIAQIYGAVSSTERIDEVLDMKHENEDSDAAAHSSTGADLYRELKEIRISNLCFSYDREEVLMGKSLVIRPGDITAITGHSGCGKSTFFLLLMGLY